VTIFSCLVFLRFICRQARQVFYFKIFKQNSHNFNFMKKFTILFLTSFLLSIPAVFSQRPVIALTFTAEYNNLNVPLDSIFIQNLTQPGDTMLFAPDTVLFLDYVSGIPDYSGTAKSSFSVSPNYPNPSVDGKTSIDVFIPETEIVTMRVFDIIGNEVAFFENTLNAGNHHFTFLAGKEKYYVLSVNCGNENRSIKMINSGCSNQMQGTLIYQGSTETEPPMKSQKATAGFDFSLGDQLQYTAYAAGYLSSIIVDIPESNKTYTFEMVSSVFTCGSTITINHVTGEVAPVDKTVTYGTVTNIPGEPSKCWITSNLGSDHQATAKNDATEASAGWYWQFNRKQGFKHTGTVRTPNTVWINNINENSDWLLANDPCALELGSGWRIPSSSEWINVDASGNWTNWNGPWNSGLKMHAAGYLTNYQGSLGNRGSYGYYWSSTQSTTDWGWSLDFFSVTSSVNDMGKADGYSIRCVRDASASTIPNVTTSPAINITQTTATGGGNVTADGGSEVTARGVCWSTSQNPTIADSHTSDGTGTGVFVSNLTGLTPNTPYFVRAYATNSLGTAYGNELNFTTLSSGFTCGSTITINHVTGEVAPVNKTVTYGTVTNIPGETSKCWITSNLGADHQATAKNDATEPSAGWYWQFNRKQGYKHTGSVRTPNTTWITTINENSEWVAAKDPCTIELGSGWRIPTYVEWLNVDANGNWTNWNGPWNSALKMHAAGFLDCSNGSVYARGLIGNYWSSTQNDATIGWYLMADPDGSLVGDDNKASGFSLRCLREQGTATLPTVNTAGITGITTATAIGGGEVTGDGGASVTARGVCWSTLPNPTTAESFTADGSGTGAFISILTNLAPGTPYYVRSYATNSMGTAYGNEVTFTTLPFLLTCDASITINHVAGAIAPVTKTVTYNIVSNIPGETSKCWIASNLGADHQAAAVSDATEPSAGWYWQFNRKQGYKHTGSVRTPNTTWITTINENLTWQASNDPCAIELGAGWRIPTITEWINVDAGGNWTNWSGPWNSALKMHAAGKLDHSDGTLVGRGINGDYWSSAQYDASYGQSLSFNNSGSDMSNNLKVSGLPLRCLSEASATTIPNVTTSPAINITQTTATGGGNVIADGGAEVTARGVCWSTTQNPTIADNHTSDETGTGAFVSNLTGLAPNTPYYVRAYATNNVGTAYGNEVTFTTLSAGFTCGTSITINHVTGEVAPVNKTVTYGTVTNIPGETSKCWITSNLGADHQATAKNDATEASAGWYWQFNRKQGYKHDGVNRSPNTSWITSINENSNWTTANDPCTIELGAGWRIPTKTEWINVESSGNWTNWNGPWNSALKMHAAGDLDATDGSLSQRGLFGAYWSSTQADGVDGFAECFSSGLIVVSMEYKPTGFSLRCVKE
jgi:uncharacterized protein (TIGR02145 family)